jgi:hypothetical protein
MPMTTGRSRTEFQALRLFWRAFAVLWVLVVGASRITLSAQIIEIKLVNGKNGLPMTGACVNVWVGSERKAAMAIPTDEDGVARLYLTDDEAQMNTPTPTPWRSCGDFGVINPVVKHAETIRINAGYVLCQPRTPNFSWLGITDFSVQQVLQHGIATANACGKPVASPKPGEIVLFVRPLTWWEKLKE